VSSVALSEIDYRIRHAIYTTFAEGGLPLSATISAKLRIPPDTLRESYDRLHAARAIVLDPNSGEVWMALPFSAKPTPFRVLGDNHEWFANCAWDAFGLPVLVGCDAVLATTCPDCDGPIVHRVERKQLIDAHGVVHFAVPAANWWDNIGFT
jgi:hypothetical protein